MEEVNIDENMEISYECSCCNKSYEIDMGITENEYEKFIDLKMKKWNSLNPLNIMTKNNTIITAIRPYESFIEDNNYNLNKDKDNCIRFDDNLKRLLNDYYNYKNYQPYFYFLDRNTEELAIQSQNLQDEGEMVYFNKYTKNKWDDDDTKYWKNNIYNKTDFYDIYVNV